LKERYRGREDEEEDVIIYLMTLKKREDNWNLKEGALDPTCLRTRFGRDYAAVRRMS
jgi:hypothetical protein